MFSPTEARILIAAMGLFGEHGYHGVTVREIAAQAKATSAAVQRLFGSKRALLREALKIAVLYVTDPDSFNRVYGAFTKKTGLSSSLMEAAGALLARAIGSESEQPRHTALDAVSKALPASDGPQPANHLRIIEFTSYRRRR